MGDLSRGYSLGDLRAVMPDDFQTVETIALVIRDKMPVEAQLRMSLSNNSQRKDLSIESQLFRGVIRAVYIGISDLIRKGEAEKKTINGKRHYRKRPAESH